jgi:hypothetical protein
MYTAVCFKILLLAEILEEIIGKQVEINPIASFDDPRSRNFFLRMYHLTT